jgi:hypothetical protein
MAAGSLRGLTSLRELYLVIILPSHSRAQQAAKVRLRRDAFGFVPYADYLRVTKATTADLTEGGHLAYQSMALSLRNALRYLSRSGVSVKKVVDVDCAMFTEDEYRRRVRWQGSAAPEQARGTEAKEM